MGGREVYLSSARGGCQARPVGAPKSCGCRGQGWSACAASRWPRCGESSTRGSSRRIRMPRRWNCTARRAMRRAPRPGRRAPLRGTWWWRSVTARGPCHNICRAYARSCICSAQTQGPWRIRGPWYSVPGRYGHRARRPRAPWHRRQAGPPGAQRFRARATAENVRAMAAWLREARPRAHLARRPAARAGLRPWRSADWARRHGRRLRHMLAVLLALWLRSSRAECART